MKSKEEILIPYTLKVYSLKPQVMTFTPDESIDVVFAEVLIYSTPKHYVFSTSSDNVAGFDKQVQNLERAVHSFDNIIRN